MNSFIKNTASRVAKVCPSLLTRILFRYDVGYWPNLTNPKSLNEKLQYLKLHVYRNNPVVTQCADKYAVRDYVSERIGEKYLVELYGCWERADDIRFDLLPDSFALKCNNGSGTNIICKDKKRIDVPATIKQLNKWMKMDFGDHRAELIYDNIPRKIICEEFINTDDGLPPKDYKFFCNYGKALFLFVATDRYEGKTKFDYYDMNWNWIPVINGHPNAGPGMKKPDNFDEMVGIAEKLSLDFPLVRVDLYNEGGRILFGELTFLHHSGLCKFEPEKYDYIFGDMVKFNLK